MGEDFLFFKCKNTKMPKKDQIVKPKKGKKVAQAPAVLLSVGGKAKDTKKVTKKKKEEKQSNPLFIARPRESAKAKRPWAKRDLTRYTRFPKYIKLLLRMLLLQRGRSCSHRVSNVLSLLLHRRRLSWLLWLMMLILLRSSFTCLLSAAKWEYHMPS